MDTSIKKQLKKGLQTEEYRLASEGNKELASANLAKNLKTTKTLEMLCQAIFMKNYNLYLKHEEMLEANKKERMDMAMQFQEEMSKITDDINAARAERQQEIEANNEIRKKIQDKIEQYRTEEAKYKSSVEDHAKQMAAAEKQYKEQLEKRVYSLLGDLNQEKAAYDKAEKLTEELNSQIREYMDKFTSLKDTIVQN